MSVNNATAASNESEEHVDFNSQVPAAHHRKALINYQSRIDSIDGWGHEEYSSYLNLLVLSGDYDRARLCAEQCSRRAPADPYRAFEYARFLVHEDSASGLRWHEQRVTEQAWLSGYLHALLRIEAGDWSAGMATIRRALRNAPVLSDALHGYVVNSMYTPQLDPVEHLSVMRELARRQYGMPPPPSGSVSRRPRYVIGFVCSNLRRHAISTFFMPLLANLDRKQFMIAVFSSTRQPDAVTSALQKMADIWYDTSRMPDEDLLGLIRSDRVDVLIDLDNHTLSNRLRVFAKRAAPIQMSLYGYNTTTGLDAIDYRLTDAIVDPPGAEDFYSEKLLRTRFCHVTYNGSTPPPAASAVAAALKFGSFNDCKKIDSMQVRQWAQILHALPESHLHVVGFDDGLAQLRVRRWMQESGIDPRQVTIEERVELDALYQRVQSVDLAIDSWPFGGAVTSAMTLALGVPLVTATGARAVSRVSASMLRDVGLSHFAVNAPEALGACAIRLGADVSALSQAKILLAQRFPQTLGNGERLGHEFGALLIRAIERFRKGKMADHDLLPDG